MHYYVHIVIICLLLLNMGNCSFKILSSEEMSLFFCSLKEENTANMTSRCYLPLAVTSVVSGIAPHSFRIYSVIVFFLDCV